MEIIGFSEQIGFFNPFKKIKKAVQTAKKTVVTKKTAMPIKPTSSGTFNRLAQRAKMMQTAQIKKPVLQKSFIQNIVNKAKVQTALKNAKQAGKSVIVKTATGIKKLTPKPAFNLVPTAFKAKQSSVIKNIVTPIKTAEINRFQNALKAMKPANEARAIFNLTPSPNVVRQLDPIQRSYLKTDLPYKVISRNNFGQPRTQIIKNTPLRFNIDIDQIEPSVDAGMLNYYGK
jgi:hypothetical protein